MVQSTGTGSMVVVDCCVFGKYLKIEVKIESQSGLYLLHEAVEKTRSEGDGCDWQYLIVDVGLPLSVMGITFKHQKNKMLRI